MKEIDLVQAMASWINLAYTAGQWWITVTTALVVATYFAAKHIPAWFFALVVLLYILTSVSIMYEVSAYTTLAFNYGTRLAEFRAQTHVRSTEFEPGSVVAFFNGWINYVVFALGSVSAVSYSYIHWRSERSAQSSAPTGSARGTSVN